MVYVRESKCSCFWWLWLGKSVNLLNQTDLLISPAKAARIGYIHSVRSQRMITEHVSVCAYCMSTSNHQVSNNITLLRPVMPSLHRMPSGWALAAAPRWSMLWRGSVRQQSLYLGLFFFIYTPSSLLGVGRLAVILLLSFLIQCQSFVANTFKSC